MKTWQWVWAGGLLAQICLAGESVSVPWEEIKRWHEESVEKRVTEKMKAGIPEKRAFVYAVEQAVCRLGVHARAAEGRVLVSGRVVDGEPAPIPVFGDDVVLTSVGTTAGGLLVADASGRGRISFLPTGEKDFQFEASFLAPVREDERSCYVTVALPQALRRSAILQLDPSLRLVEHPGLADTGGVYRLASGQPLVVRFTEARAEAERRGPEVDLFSWIRFPNRKAAMTTVFLPRRPSPESVKIRAPAGWRLVSSSLEASRVRRIEADLYQVDTQADAGRFTVEWACDLTEGAPLQVALPTVEGNQGREGWFAVEEPEDAEVEVEGRALTRDAPVSEIRADLLSGGARPRTTFRTRGGEAVALRVRWFEAVAAPPAVAESLRFCTGFEENGGMLSVVQVEVPPAAGPRLELKAVPGAEVWSLTVNGRRQRVFTRGDGMWVVTLANGEKSSVELAFLRRGTKLGLQGRLEAVLPEMSLSANRVVVGIGLPGRVELLSVEGPVSPDPAAAGPLPAAMTGKAYFFSRSYHKGEEMKLAALYKEPAEAAGE